MWKRVAFAAGLALLLGGSAQGARTAAPVNTAPPTISGTPREGENLTASTGTWSGSTPINFRYRWHRCNSGGGNCDAIANTDTPTYKVSDRDVGRRLRVLVTAANSSGSSAAFSAATAVIAGSDPVNTAKPTISGTPRSGSTLTAIAGAWSGAGPLSFSYEWRRCNGAGDNCRGVGGNDPHYRLTSADVGSRIRVQVRARNSFGSTEATSDPTGTVAPGGPVPASTAPPVISGTPRDNQTLVASAGSWTNGPTRFDFQWLRCDAVGAGCGPISSGQSYRVTSHDVGHTLRVVVAATNQFGTGASTSVPTAVVSAAIQPGSTISVQQVLPPQRLIVSAIRFEPSRLHSRAAFIGRFRVTDTRGFVISGALVYAIGLPYGWVRNAPEVITGNDGWATIQFLPTNKMPLRRAALVLFVRARKPGDNLLAGVSTRRLVQVGIG
jgi:hypothetical protein